MLEGKQIAVLVANGFEETEMTVPYLTLEEAGADVHLLSTEESEVLSWENTSWGTHFQVDQSLSDLSASSLDLYDAVIVPGGILSVDRLRTNPQAIHLIATLSQLSKPVGVIGYGAWLLINANAVANRTVTSTPSIQLDLKNAGGIWSNSPLVVDGPLFSCQSTLALPDFTKAIVYQLQERPQALML